jgi:cytochrome c2
MKKKRIMAIGRKSPAFDKLIVDPDFCPHLNMVTIMPSSSTGDPQDAEEPFAQCLDCNSVMDGNRQWVMPEVVNSDDRIPY